MNKKRKPIRYRVVIAHSNGDVNGIPTYYFKWVCKWPNVIKWGSHYEESPPP